MSCGDSARRPQHSRYRPGVPRAVPQPARSRLRSATGKAPARRCRNYPPVVGADETARHMGCGQSHEGDRAGMATAAPASATAQAPALMAPSLCAGQTGGDVGPQAKCVDLAPHRTEAVIAAATIGNSGAVTESPRPAMEPASQNRASSRESRSSSTMRRSMKLKFLGYGRSRWPIRVSMALWA